MTNTNYDVSIEYAHIYTNTNINKEQILSIKLLEELKQTLEKTNTTFTLVVLVDDYSFPDPTFNYEDFVQILATNGFKPDLLMRESQLIPLCDEVLWHITNKNLKDQITHYIKNKKYPCSLFVASWYLLRLGYLTHPTFSKSLYAKKLINILPKSFKEYEDKAFEIISNTKFLSANKNIENKYIDGRVI